MNRLIVFLALFGLISPVFGNISIPVRIKIENITGGNLNQNGSFQNGTEIDQHVQLTVFLAKNSTQKVLGPMKATKYEMLGPSKCRDYFLDCEQAAENNISSRGSLKLCKGMASGEIIFDGTHYDFKPYPEKNATLMTYLGYYQVLIGDQLYVDTCSPKVVIAGEEHNSCSSSGAESLKPFVTLLFASILIFTR